MSQIVPDKIDYQNFPLPFRLITNAVGGTQFRQAISFGSCRIVYNPVCPDPDVTFFLFTKENPEYPVPILVGSSRLVSNLNSTLFDATKPTKIIIHGYNSNMNISALVEIRNEYLRTKDFNIFTVDWSPLNQSPCYLGAVINIRHVGTCTAQLVERLLELGNTDIHVLGFSLGAHVTNYMAIALRPYRVPRITGLDPALPGFTTWDLDSKLDKTDAEFVDVYHTNAFFQGKVEESGHVDFYVNGGVFQPGCWAQIRYFACNHHRAPLYYAESINTVKGFYGWPCPSYFDYLLGRCLPKDPQILIGEYIAKGVQGVYLVITESVSPFAVGKYEGPSVEILKQFEAHRMAILDKYKNIVIGYVDEDDLLDQLYNQRNIKSKISNKLFEVVLDREENADLISVLN
ncbi:lipase member H-A-like [Diorhabda carinulata]|uniref:lipase member H-A-like n=1 Tax=Diorhabda carinulata TaxID=1163345 RepID=UPI0025A13998|nr:lipase member H-A-like [Diorhabda carinulata]